MPHGPGAGSRYVARGEGRGLPQGRVRLYSETRIRCTKSSGASTLERSGMGPSAQIPSTAVRPRRSAWMWVHSRVVQRPISGVKTAQWVAHPRGARRTRQGEWGQDRRCASGPCCGRVREGQMVLGSRRRYRWASRTAHGPRPSRGLLERIEVAGSRCRGTRPRPAAGPPARVARATHSSRRWGWRSCRSGTTRAALEEPVVRVVVDARRHAHA